MKITLTIVVFLTSIVTLAQNLGFEGRINSLSIGVRVQPKVLSPVLNLERSLSPRKTISITATTTNRTLSFNNYGVKLNPSTIDKIFRTSENGSIQINSDQSMKGQFKSSVTKLNSTLRFYNILSNSDLAPLGSFVELGVECIFSDLDEMEATMIGNYYGDPVRITLTNSQPSLRNLYFHGVIGVGGKQIIGKSGILSINLNGNFFYHREIEINYFSHIDAAHDIAVYNSGLSSILSLNFTYGYIF